MAACLITTGGTNGTLRIDFKDVGGDANQIYSTFGDIIWIDDAATNITYTTLTGDVTATSGCVTITNLPIICYEFIRDQATTVTETSVFDAVVVGVTVYPITNVPIDLINFVDLVEAVNTTLNNDAIKFTATKDADLGNGYWQINSIMRIIGSGIPQLRIKSFNGNYSYLTGVVSTDCSPTGYDAIITYQPIPL